MYQELTNLLPDSNRRAFLVHYFLRVGTVALMLLSFVVLIHSVLLVPSYIFLSKEMGAKKAELNQLSSTLQTTEEQQVQQEESSITAETSYLSSFSDSDTASTALRAVLAVARSGIALTGFTYTPEQDGSPITIEVDGIANSREALRAYDQLLSSLPFVTSANLPISDYAATSNIQFTITLSLSSSGT